MRHAVRSAIPLFAILFAFPALASITGTVMNADGGAVAGAKVAAYAPETLEARRVRLVAHAQRPALGTATTGTDGSFRVDVPKDQRFADVRIDAAGYAPDNFWSLADDEAGAIVLTKAPARTGTITANGKPVAGATVVWLATNGTDTVAVTDANGKYSVPDPSKWAIRVVVMHPDYATVIDTMIRDAARMTPDRTLTAGVKVTGKLVGEDGNPAAGAELWLDRWPAGKTNDDGTFTLAHVRKDWQELEAHLGARVAKRPHADGALAMKLVKGATFTGTLLDSKTMQPVAGATVTLLGGGPGGGGAGGGETLHTAITNEKGGFTFANLAASSFNVNFGRPGYHVPPVEVALVAGRTLQKQYFAAPLGTVAGTVLDEDKRPVAAAHISARAAAREGMMMNPMAMFNRFGGRAVYSGPDGRFVARNVQTDSDVLVEAAKKGFPSAQSAAFRLNPGEKKAGMNLTIPRGLALSGRVVDKNNKAVSGAVIEVVESTQDPTGPMRRIMTNLLSRPNDDAVRSASDGSFTVRAKEGRYDVLVKAEGYAAKTLRAQSVVPAMKPVEVVLEPGVEITGRVTRGGVGVDNVMVATMSMTEGMQSTTSGADGSFRLTDLTPGQMMLILNRQDAFIQEMRPVTAPAKDVNIELPAGGRIVGHVVDKGTHQPVTSFQAGVTTSRGGGGMVIQTPPMLKPFTSDDGSFALDNVRPGPTQVVVSAPGYTQARVPNIEVEDGKTAPDVSVELDTGTKLTGKVTGPDGAALSGVTVAPDMTPRGGRVMRMDMMNVTAVTDPNGEYSIEALEPGEKTFTYSRSGYVTEQRTLNLNGKETRSDVQLSNGLRVNGLVTTESGAPVADAVVRASSASDSMFGREARSDGGGGFSFEGLAPGHYTFTAAKSGYANGIARDVDVAAGAPVRVMMKSGGTITGHVSGLTADELQQTNVTASAPSAGSVSAPVDAGGNYRIDGAPTGTVRVSARVGGFMAGAGKSSDPKTVVLDPGGSASADIEFRSNTVIQGRITRGGRPLQNASVMFFPRQGKAQTTASATADSNGYYQLSGLADGPYGVQVVDFERVSPYTTQYEVKGSDTYNIDIKVGTVRGHVIDASTNQPISDAHVELRGTSSDSMMGMHAQQTDANGTFIMDTVSLGAYQITADKDGYGHVLQDLQVTESTADQELKLSPSAGVTLNVVDGRDGRMIAASPQVVDMQGRSVAGGGFRFSSTPEPIQLDLAPGQYRVTLMAQGYAMTTVTVTSPAPAPVRVPMTPGGSLLIKSKSSTPQRARLVARDGTFYGRFGMGEGIFSLNASPGVTTLQYVAPGTYRIEVLDASDKVIGWTSATVSEGVATTVEV